VTLLSLDEKYLFSIVSSRPGNGCIAGGGAGPSQIRIVVVNEWEGGLGLDSERFRYTSVVVKEEGGIRLGGHT